MFVAYNTEPVLIFTRFHGKQNTPVVRFFHYLFLMMGKFVLHYLPFLGVIRIWNYCEMKILGTLSPAKKYLEGIREL